MRTWRVERRGKGELSTIRVSAFSRPVAFSMTQQEARELVNELSHVVLMPPRERVSRAIAEGPQPEATKP